MGKQSIHGSCYCCWLISSLLYFFTWGIFCDHFTSFIFTLAGNRKISITSYGFNENKDNSVKEKCINVMARMSFSWNEYKDVDFAEIHLSITG